MNDLVISETGAIGPRQTILLDGEDWELIDFPSVDQGSIPPELLSFVGGEGVGRSISARVPGDIHDDLERAGRLPDLWYSTQSTQAQWVPQRDWYYRKRFTPDASWRSRHLVLELDGLDYAGEVFLNGEKLGSHEGAFVAARFDISDHVVFDRDNVLVVLIRRAPEAVLEKLFLPRSQENRQLAMDEVTRQLPRWKSRTLTGWDWGTPLWTMGLWRSVRIVATGCVRIQDAVVLPRLEPPYRRASLPITVRLTSDRGGEVALSFRIQCLTHEDEPVVSTRVFTLSPGEQELGHTVELDHPRLWWPNGEGEQHRYGLAVSAADAKTREPLDAYVTEFGIRDLRVVTNPSAEDHRVYKDHRAKVANDVWFEHGMASQTLELPEGHESACLMVINGRRIFARGANWVPADLLFGRVEREQLEHLIRLAALANYNVLRVWGGGLIESPDFYDLCNRYGLMVWQEMPHAGRRPLEDDVALSRSAGQQQQVMRSLMNHPSLVRYGFGNELYLGREDSSQLAQFLDICERVDPTRPAQGASPVTTHQRHAPHWFDFSVDYETYNTGHPLTVGADNPAEWTEYGASGASCVETLDRIMPASSRWPICEANEDWRWHNGFGAYLGDDWLLPQFYRPLFGELPDLATEVRVSQWAQAEGLRYAHQAHRRAKWHRSGCYHWTFNEPWPNAAHGCVVEYHGRTKPAYHATARSYAAVDVSARYPGLRVDAAQPLPVRLFVTSDRPQPLAGCTFEAVLFETSGHVVTQQHITLDVPAKATQELDGFELGVPKDAGGRVLLLQLSLTDSAATTLSRQTYTFAVRGGDAAASAPLRPLLHTPPTQLRLESVGTSTVEIHGAPARRHRLTLHNDGDAPALFVDVQTVLNTRGIYVVNSGNTILPGASSVVDVLDFVNNSAPSNRINAKGWNTAAVEHQL